MPTMTVTRNNSRRPDMDLFRRALAQLSASVSVGEPEQSPATSSYQKRAGHAAVTDRYGWPGL
ncbi:hypothetical protein ACIHDR_17620 [Nocardia sp. NPDC052278]|uniref:hypothetical protein n=1 Tax=unclassified Nocardia TaxID=2637762 RepID=UPI0036AF825F